MGVAPVAGVRCRVGRASRVCSGKNIGDTQVAGPKRPRCLRIRELHGATHYAADGGTFQFSVYYGTRYVRGYDVEAVDSLP